MEGRKSGVAVRIKSRVHKFREDADVAKDAPYETLEHEHLLQGDEALAFLKGVNKNATSHCR